MKSTKFLFLALLAFASCKKDEDPDKLINPADANALSKVLIIPDADRNNGDPPSSTFDPQAPVVTGATPSQISSNGSTVPLTFNYDNVNGNLAGCYAQVEGADTYFAIPYNATSNESGFLSLPIGIPVNVDSGSFVVYFCVYDGNGLVSNPTTTTINVLRLGTGALQISLSWDTPTDQDLHVVDPSGYEIYYGDTYSSTGGQLDRDDLDGYGPENIFWLSDAPDGKYEVSVDDYEGTFSPNTVYVTVNGGGKSKTFTATTQNGSTAQIVTIVKSGESFSF
ncbi:MAG: hypothetical protein H6577_19810 [Lewinellaceae bacterium]|nr:hypothetical protein [Saprospiraceae bacterium]MCB9340375.1 hypothetical protein [Lewinellaceae bacterium]